MGAIIFSASLVAIIVILTAASFLKDDRDNDR
jgi:hypothetical protein